MTEEETFAPVAMRKHFRVGVFRPTAPHPAEQLLKERRRLGNEKWNATSVSATHTHAHTPSQRLIQKFWKGGGGRQLISSVLIYRKCAQRNICLIHWKKRLLN